MAVKAVVLPVVPGVRIMVFETVERKILEDLRVRLNRTYSHDISKDITKQPVWENQK